MHRTHQTVAAAPLHPPKPSSPASLGDTHEQKAMVHSSLARLAAASSSSAAAAAAVAAAAADAGASASASARRLLPHGGRVLTEHLQPSSLPLALSAARMNVAHARPQGGAAGATEPAAAAAAEARGSTSALRRRKSLFDHLAALPNNGVGSRVRQTRWVSKGLDVPHDAPLVGPSAQMQQQKNSGVDADGHLSYWEITRARIRTAQSTGRPHGKAWGRLVWRGACPGLAMATETERIWHSLGLVCHLHLLRYHLLTATTTYPSPASHPPPQASRLHPKARTSSSAAASNLFGMPPGSLGADSRQCTIGSEQCGDCNLF